MEKTRQQSKDIYSLRLGAEFDHEFPGIPGEKTNVKNHIIFI